MLKEAGYDRRQSALSAYMSTNDIKKISNKKLEEYKNKPKPRTFTISSVIKMIYKNFANLKTDEIKKLKELKYFKLYILVTITCINFFFDVISTTNKSLIYIIFIYKYWGN